MLVTDEDNFLSRIMTSVLRSRSLTQGIKNGQEGVPSQHNILQYFQGPSRPYLLSNAIGHPLPIGGDNRGARRRHAGLRH